MIFGYDVHELDLKIVGYLTTLFQLLWWCLVLKTVITFGE
jgi:hypothetical protein